MSLLLWSIKPDLPLQKWSSAQLDGGGLESGQIQFEGLPQLTYNVVLYSIANLKNVSHTLTIALATIEPFFFDNALYT